MLLVLHYRDSLIMIYSYLALLYDISSTLRKWKKSYCSKAKTDQKSVKYWIFLLIRIMESSFRTHSFVGVKISHVDIIAKSSYVNVVNSERIARR
jgi:hypothetical protein